MTNFEATIESTIADLKYSEKYQIGDLTAPSPETLRCKAEARIEDLAKSLCSQLHDLKLVSSKD